MAMPGTMRALCCAIASIVVLCLGAEEVHGAPLTWNKVAKTTSAVPAQRLGHAIWYDANRDDLILYGGR